ncbi:MAG: ABC transporter permease [Bryobacteraceae bacterium]
MTALIQDLRYTFRQLIKNPGFTAVAVLTMALGIGANTAIFSVVDAVLLRPLPYPEPEQIVTISPAGMTFLRVLRENKKDFTSWQSHTRSIESVAYYQAGDVNLNEGTEPERLHAAQVTGDFFRVLGVAPLRGGGFTPDAGEKAPQAVISHGLWQRRFGGDPNLIGKLVRLNGFSTPVAGIMPAGFAFPQQVDVWVPPGVCEDTLFQGVRFSYTIGRLARGFTLAQAQAEMDAITEQVRPLDRNLKNTPGIRLTSLQDSLTWKARKGLLILLAAVSLVLLIAAVNLANLLLLRSAGRAREFAVRAAVGAGRWRLIRQLLTETELLVLLGGVCGVLVARLSLDFLVTVLPLQLPALNRIGIDTRVLVFAAAVSVTVGLLCGIAPAFAASKTDLIHSLKENPQSPSRSRSLFRSVLMVTEVALACVLLVGSGLMMRTLVRLFAVDPGFKTEGVMTLDISLPTSRYAGAAQVNSYFEQVLARIEALPGVHSAGAINYLPMGGSSYFLLPVATESHAADMSRLAAYRVVEANYFRALSIPLRTGRFFTTGDNAASPKVAIVNEAMARAFWPGQNPVGRRFKAFELLEVAGVVGDVRHDGLTESARPEFYIPLRQSSVNWMSLVVRTAVDPKLMIGAIRGQVLSVDKEQPISRIRTMKQVVDDSVGERRADMLLLSAFAGLALMLAAVGVYGVVAHSAAQRTHEFGIRRAVGADTRDLLRSALGEGITLTVAGIVIGLASASATSRLLGSLLFGVAPTDPATFAAAGGVLLLTAAAASYIPARRASKVDPVVALRCE